MHDEIYRRAVNRPRVAPALGALEQVAVLEGLGATSAGQVVFPDSEGLTFADDKPIKYTDATIPERLQNFWSGLMQPALGPWLTVAGVAAGALLLWKMYGDGPSEVVAVQGLSGSRRKRRRSRRKSR